MYDEALKIAQARAAEFDVFICFRIVNINRKQGIYTRRLINNKLIVILLSLLSWQWVRG